MTGEARPVQDPGGMKRHTLSFVLSAALAAACTSAPQAPQGAADLAVLPGDAAVGPDAASGGLAQLGEEFDSGGVGRLADLYPALHDALPLAGAAPGRLALAPIQVAQTHWYSDSEGPLLYRTVTGDFVVETDVNVGRRDDPSQPPRGGFNAGGLLVRDPASARRGQRWIMYNLGHQVDSFAREVKTTRPGAAESLSTLYLIQTAAGVRGGRLRICRLGEALRFFHQHPGEAGWTEEAYGPGTSPLGNGGGEPTPGVVVGGVIRFLRPDLPATVQVGLMVGAWDAPLDTRAEFDYLRFGEARTAADCTAPLR